MRFDFDSILKGTVLVCSVVILAVLLLWIKAGVLRGWAREDACAAVGGVIVDVGYYPACVKLGEMQIWNIE